MAQQVYGSPFVPLSGGQYVGAGAVVAFTDTPSNSGGDGITLAAAETALNVGKSPSDRDRKVTSISFSVEGGTIHVTTTGKTPTAAIGVAYAAGVYEWENDGARIHGFKAWVPVGVTLNVEYGGGA